MPAYPQGNSLIENFNRMISKVLHIQQMLNTKIESKNLINFLEIIEHLPILLQENLLRK